MATKFIRVRGRIVPINERTGATKGSKRRYPGVGRSPRLVAAGAAIGTAIGALAPKGHKAFGMATGAFLGAALGLTGVVSKNAKGESDKHLAMRISRAVNARRKSSV